MIRIEYLALAVLVVPARLVLANAPVRDPAEGRPRMVIREPVKDFGTVPKGQPLSWDFEVRNEGDFPLDIRVRRYNLGELYLTIEPGDFACVPISIETKNFSGPISKSVTIESNDLGIPNPPRLRPPDNPISNPIASVFPAGARFQLSRGNSETKSVVLRCSAPGHPFYIDRVECSQPFFSATIGKHEPLSQDGRTYAQEHLDMTLAADAPVGKFHEQALVYTNLSSVPIVLPIFGEIAPAVFTRPEALNFGTVRSLADAECITSVNWTDANRHSFDVTRVRVVRLVKDRVWWKPDTIPGISTRIRRWEPEHQYLIYLTLNPLIGTGLIEGTLEIETEDPAAPMLEVPVRGLVVSGSG